MTVDRRTVLRTGAALASVGGIAGVSTGDTDGRAGRSLDGAARARQGSVPEYANWIPAPSAVSDPQSVGVAYSATTEAALGPDSEEAPSDPMLANPATLGGASTLTWLGLGQLGIHEPVIGPTPEEGERDPADVPTERTLVVGSETNTTVYLGSFDAGAIRAAVDAGSFSEASGELYAHDEQERFLTWNDRAVVVGNSQSLVEAVRAAGTGEGSRRHEADDDWAWLLRTAGSGGLTCAILGEGGPAQVGQGGSGDSPMDFSMFEGSRGVAQTASVEGGALARASAAVVYPSADDVAVDRLESALGTAADDTALTSDGPRVTMAATYDGSQVGDGAPSAATATDAPDGSDGGGSGGGDGDGGGSGGDGDGGGGGDGDGGGGGDGDGGGGGGGDGDGDPDGTASGSGPGPGVLAGLAGVAGVGYLIGRRAGGDGDE
ncbi:hypothetical protein [Halosimplex marinum]|uniref:hypothetical protein n=1 Tax=Halosimplex marinum TaxID=3396620 RepID=UPI003F57418F